MIKKFKMFEAIYFFTFYLVIPFMLYLSTKNDCFFHYYFIMSLCLIAFVSVYRILKKSFSKDYDMMITMIIKIVHFDKNSLVSIFGIVALIVTILDLPLKTVTIFNSLLVAVIAWIFYLAFIGFFNLVLSIEDMDDIENYKNSWELKQFLKILPESLREVIIRKIENKEARNKRCAECAQAYNSIDKPPRFIV